jgi:hypothetical protein
MASAVRTMRLSSCAEMPGWPAVICHAPPSRRALLQHLTDGLEGAETERRDVVRHRDMLTLVRGVIGQGCGAEGVASSAVASLGAKALDASHDHRRWLAVTQEGDLAAGVAARISSVLLQIMITTPGRRTKTLTTIFTIGHSTHPFAEFLALLQQVAVDLVVDVRSIPRSRTNPQFNVDSLPEALAAAGISYRHLPTLGGLRHRKKGAAPSLNTFWKVTAFRNYADYAGTDAFRSGLNELRALSRDNCCAIMCAEAVWWRCHRRIIADYLLVQGVPVMHIMGRDKIEPAKLTPGAQALPDGTLVYRAADKAV